MKKHLGLILTLVLLSNLLILPQVDASHINAFTFFIPYDADDLKDQFELGRTGAGAIDADEIVTTISISVLHNNTTVYYDHWEDELEPNITSPIQSSTEVFTADAGDVITLQNPVPVPRPDPPTSNLYDGGDKISAVGGSIAVSLAVWPFPLAIPGLPGYLYAGAWELYPTSLWCDEVVIPVGVDLASRPAPEPSRLGFTVVGFNVQAVENDTVVDLFLPDGTLGETIELLEGKNLSVPMDTPGISQVEAGTRVEVRDGGGPIQVHLFTGDPAQTYEARAYTLLCHDDWGTEYLAPRSSDGDFWLYNDNDTPLSVEVETVAGVQPPITIPANGVARYPPTGGVLTERSGVLFTSTGGEFYGIAALDDAQVQDWGYSLLPTDYLTTQALIGWAPGNSSVPPASWPGDPAGLTASRVYVTAEDAVTITVVFNNEIDTPNRDIGVPPLEEVDIVDDVDYDMTGAYLSTTGGEPFIAVWGQDADAPPPEPSIDVGTNIAPLRAPSLQKTYFPDTEGYNCGTSSQPHRYRFDLRAYNDSAIPIPGAVVRDELPPEFSYELGTTTLDGQPVDDDTSGTPFPLDEDGLNIGTLDPRGEVEVSFFAETDATGESINVAWLRPPEDPDPTTVDVQVPVLPAGYQVTKTLVDPPSGPADPGQTVTFNMTISNTGSITITQLPLRDEFDVDVLTFSDASVPPSSVDANTGTITWADLTDSFGDLAPSTPPQTLSVSFVVNSDLPSGVTSTINLAFSSGASGSDRVPQAITCAEAQVGLAAPTPTPTLTPTPTPPPEDGDDDDDETPTPPPPPPPPPATSTPPPAPTPAVLFLPETGVGYPKVAPVWPLVVLPGLGLLLGWIVYRRRNK